MPVCLVYGCVLACIKEQADSANTEQRHCSTQKRNFKQNLELYNLSALIWTGGFFLNLYKKKMEMIFSPQFLF
jgi:hypothetical protein